VYVGDNKGWRLVKAKERRRGVESTVDGHEGTLKERKACRQISIQTTRQTTTHHGRRR